MDEIEIFGTDPENSDTTGDGIPDGLSLRLGLNPADPGSRFTLTSIEPDTEEGLRITWPTRPGNTYYIEKSTNLIDWTLHGDPIIADSDTATVTLPADEDIQKFYRVLYVE